MVNHKETKGQVFRHLAAFLRSTDSQLMPVHCACAAATAKVRGTHAVTHKHYQNIFSANKKNSDVQTSERDRFAVKEKEMMMLETQRCRDTAPENLQLCWARSLQCLQSSAAIRVAQPNRRGKRTKPKSKLLYFCKIFKECNSTAFTTITPLSISYNRTTVTEIQQQSTDHYLI
jgi:hypothetical protein